VPTNFGPNTLAPKEKRGILSGLMQFLLTTGLFSATLVAYFIDDMDDGWRITLGWVMIAPIIILIGIWFVPESPRWLYKHKGQEAARSALKKLRGHDNIDQELKEIGDDLALEANEASWGEVFSKATRGRVILGMALQGLQQATGVNVMFNYGGIVANSVIGAGLASQLVLTSVNWVSTLPGLILTDKLGRRTLFIYSGALMVVGYAFASLFYYTGCDGDTDTLECTSSLGWLMIISIAFFIANFAVSWGPLCWIYPAEINPTRIRSKAVSLSTATNWSIAIAMSWVVKLFPYIGFGGVFIMFTGLCTLCVVAAFFFCPETKGLTLEEIDDIFNPLKKNAKDIKTPVVA